MSDNNSENNRQKNNKVLILTIGVSFFAILIAALWFVNIRQIIFQARPDNNADRQYWQQLQAELDDDLKDFNLVWNEVRPSEELAQGEELIDQIKERIESDLINELATSTLEAANEQLDSEENLLDNSQAIENDDKLPLTDSKKTIHCPEFINCMPGPDRVSPCVVPPGCEDVTLIAY